jgi:hypothetical protein
LKLCAKDSEDVQVVSAILQDSIAPVCDIMFDAEKKNFIMVVHRLRREEETGAEMERICCAVNISGVDKAQLHGIDLTHRERMLDLLAVMIDNGNLVFIFAGDAKIRIKAEAFSMIVEDFGEAWPASCRPCHETEDRKQMSDDRR